jgi:hypothetical protein
MGIKSSTLAHPRTSLAAFITTSEDSPRNVQAFEEWCTQYGVQTMNGVQLYSEDGLDWQIVTTEDLPEGTAFLYIPADMVLSSDRASQELNAVSNGGVSDAVQQLGKIGGADSISKFYLFLKVLMEYDAQEESSYLPWLDSLPRLHFSAVSMTDFCYECLPPLVFNLSRAEQLKFDNFVQVLKKVDVISDYVKSNKEVLKWAFNSVYTRAFSQKYGQSDDGAAVAMYADMFNHAAFPEADVYFDEEGNCMAYTLVDVPANTPLRISYGDPTNPSLLFARYGFMDESSPASFCKMMDIANTPENIDMGMDFTKMLFYHETGDISQEVLDIVLYAKVLSNTKYGQNVGEVKNQFYEAHMTGDEQTKAQIHDQYRYEVMTEIMNHCNTFLESLERLERKSYSKSFDEHPRLPVILQHNECVKQTFLKVKANLEPLLQQYEGISGDNLFGSEVYSNDEGWTGIIEQDEYGYNEEYVY